MRLIEKMQEWLARESLRYFAADEEDALILWLGESDHRTTVHVVSDEACRCIVVMADGNIYMPVSRRTAAAEYLVRANYGLSSGSFQMDPDNGKVFFQTSLVAPVDPDAELMRPLVSVACATYACHHASLLAVSHPGTNGATRLGHMRNEAHASSGLLSYMQ